MRKQQSRSFGTYDDILREIFFCNFTPGVCNYERRIANVAYSEPGRCHAEPDANYRHDHGRGIPREPYVEHAAGVCLSRSTAEHPHGSECVRHDQRRWQPV